MVAVSDTSPLSNLAIIGRPGLLRDQFRTVLVPAAVRQELSRLRHTAAAGSLNPKPGDRDITDLISDDRDGN